MARDVAIYLSTAGIQVGVGYETVSGQKPETFLEIQGITSISEVSSKKETIEVTPLSAKVYKEYVGALADPGGTLELGANESNVLHKSWAAVVAGYKTALSSNLRTWFEIYIPEFDEAFYVVGEPNELGFGGADVSSALTTTVRITTNQVVGWDTPVAISTDKNPGDE